MKSNWILRHILKLAANNNRFMVTCDGTKHHITWLYRDFVENWNLCCHTVTSRESSISQSVSSFMSCPYFYLTQCDMKKVFASLSKFVSESARQILFSILSWGKILKSNLSMMFDISVMAKSLSSTVPLHFGQIVTVWHFEVPVKKSIYTINGKRQSSCKWSSTILG